MVSSFSGQVDQDSGILFTASQLMSIVTLLWKTHTIPAGKLMRLAGAQYRF